MSSTNCSVCAAGSAPTVNGLRAEGMGMKRIARDNGFTEWAIRSHFKNCEVSESATEKPLAADETAKLELNGDSGTITTNSSEPITDWDAILEIWDLDPKQFEVIEPVGMSARTLASGATLYSYRAKVRRVSAEVEQVANRLTVWRDTLFATPERSVSMLGGGASYVICIADPQIGKKGTFEAIDNWQRGVRGHIDRIKSLIRGGHQITEVVVAFCGDEHEGVANNYANQPYTVEMNFSTQLETDFDLRMWTIKLVTDELDDVIVKVVSVISNHGEFTRNGSKDPVTSRGDNSSTMIARMCQRAFEGMPGYKNIEWLIAGGEPAVVTMLSGVKTYISHGYVEKGRGQGPEARQVSAMQSQVLANPLGLGDVRVFLLAHYHHAWNRQDRGNTVFGMPALEARQSSEYMLEQYGVWSEPGMAGLLIGKECGSLGWSDYTII